MKTTILILLVSCVVGLADMTSLGFISESEVARAKADQAQRESDLRNAIVIDPIRIIGGKTNAVGAGWARIMGHVVGVHPDGIRVDGYYSIAGGDNYEGEFFVANFPYRLAEGDQVDSPTRWFFAKVDGVYTYPTAIGGMRTLRKLDYGKVFTPPPPSVESIAAANAAAMV